MVKDFQKIISEEMKDLATRARERKLQRHGDFAISLFLADFAMHNDVAGVCTGFESVSRHPAGGRGHHPLGWGSQGRVR